MNRSRLVIAIAVLVALAPVPVLRVLGGRGIESIAEADEIRKDWAIQAVASDLRTELTNRLQEIGTGTFDLDPARLRVADPPAGSAFVEPAILRARASLAKDDGVTALEALDTLLAGSDAAGDARLLALTVARLALESLGRGDLSVGLVDRIRAIDARALTLGARSRLAVESATDASARASLLGLWMSDVEERATDLDELAHLRDAARDRAIDERVRDVARREGVAAEILRSLGGIEKRGGIDPVALIVTSHGAFAITPDRDRVKRVDVGAVMSAAGASSTSGLPATEWVRVPRVVTWLGVYADLGESSFFVRLGASGFASTIDPRFLLDAGLWLYVLLALALGVAIFRQQARAEALAGTRADLIAQITHELRTPLTVLRMYGESLAQGRVPIESRDDYVKTMADEAARLGAMVDRVARAARDGGAGAESIGGDCRAADVLDRLVATYSRATSAAGGSLETHVDLGDSRVPLDADDLRLVLDVVLDNALAYGGSPPRIEVDAGVERERVRITVQDHGPGVAEDERIKLFERFQRLGEGIRSGRRGAGMGLWLARRAARAAGGDVGLEFQDGGGTLAIVELPIVAEGSHASSGEPAR